MRYAASLSAAALTLAGLGFAIRALVPMGDRALIPVALLFGLVLAGHLRIAARRRAAEADAVLAPGSSWRWLIAGRVGTAARALLATGLSVPYLAYQIATLRAYEPLVMALTGLLALAVYGGLLARVGGHFRDRTAFAFLARPAFALAIVPVFLLQAWLSFSVWPLPDWLSTGLLPTLDAAARSLPTPGGVFHEAASLIAVSEALLLWLLHSADFAMAPSLIVLARQALAGAAIIDVTLALAALALWQAERPADG